MSAEKTNFTTASGESLHYALGYRQNPDGTFTRRLDTEENGILEEGTHFGGFSISHNFIEKVAQNSRIDGKKPDELSIGRECYSFSERENRVFVIAMREAESLVGKINSPGGGKCSLSIETDAIGNLYMRVKGQKESAGEDFETHMIGSHLDSVENGGKYDGVAGIAAGLETMQQVLYHQASGTLQNSFCLTIFRSEESSPNNGIACLGSAIATGIIDDEELKLVVYTRQNGKDVLLKEHLESSLRRYFQSKDKAKTGDWGEGEEYIDHEWWYWFCNQHDITQENYESGVWWDKILDLQKNPKVTKDNTASYRELHIEQQKLIAGEDKDLGIVSGGIGGAKRYKTMNPISVESREISSDEYEVYSFTIQGFADHTGSTPNNPQLKSSEYRRDAQIATNLLLREFLEGDFGELIASQAENAEGYTKVPFSQKIELAIKKDKKSAFTQFVRSQRKLLREENSIEFSRGRYKSAKEIYYISRDSAKQQIGALLGVSESASNEFRRQKEDNPEEKGFGSTRATLTNVHLTPRGLDFMLDIREINTDDVERLIHGVSQELQIILPEGIEGLKKVSEKYHEEIDETMRDTSRVVSDILGYTSIFIPSMPGHDADRIAAAGVPIGMIFVRQEEGVSHNPAEKMEDRYYNRAAHTIMKSLLADLV